MDLLTLSLVLENKSKREKKFCKLTTLQISVLTEHDVDFSWWRTRWPVGEMCLGLSILSASPSSMSTLSQVEQWPLHQPCMAPLSSSALLPSGLGSVLTHGFPSSPHHRWCHQLAQEQSWQQAGHMGAMDSHQCLTWCLLSLLFSSILSSVLDLHSHQRTTPKEAEVTAKLLELSFFKSHLWYRLVRFPVCYFPTEMYYVRERSLGNSPRGFLFLLTCWRRYLPNTSFLLLSQISTSLYERVHRQEASPFWEVYDSALTSTAKCHRDGLLSSLPWL